MKRSVFMQLSVAALLACTSALVIWLPSTPISEAPLEDEIVSADFIHPANESIKAARELIQSSRFEDARLSLELLAEHDSEMVRGQAVCSLAEVAIRTGAFDQAASLITRCLSIAGKGDDLEALLAFGRHLSGFLSQLKGQYHEAIIDFETALQLEVVSSGAHSAPFLNTLNNLGNVHYRLGQLDIASQIHREVLEGRRNILGEYHPQVAASLGNLGNVLEASGDSEMAYRFHVQALEIWRRHYDPQHIQIGYSLNNVGVSLLKLGRYSEAAIHLRESIEIKNAVLGIESPKTISSLSNLAEVYLRMGEYGKARESVNLAIKIGSQNRLTDLPAYWASINVLAKIDLADNKAHAALNRLERELDRLGPSVAIEKIDLLSTRASVCLKLNDFPCALDAAQHAIDLNAGIVGSGQRESYSLLQKASSHDRLVTSLFLKAQALLELAKESQSNALRLRAFDTFDVALSYAQSFLAGQDNEQYSVEPIANVRDQLSQFLSTGLALFQESGDQYLASRMFAIVDVHNGGLLLASMRNKSPETTTTVANRQRLPRTTGDLFAQFDTVSPSEIRQGYSIIEYFEIDSDLYVAVVGNDGYTFHQLGLADSLEVTTRRYREALKTRAFHNVYELSFDLYQQLLLPVEKVISGDNLVIIPSGTLKGIAFETLLTESIERDFRKQETEPLPYLMLKNGISYSFSASLLEIQEGNDHSDFDRDLLALAPVFDDEDGYSDELNDFLTAVSREAPIRRLVSLPGTAQEVTQIGEILRRSKLSEGSASPKPNLVLLRGNSREHELKSMDLSGVRIIHIATHSFINPHEPDSSGIILETNGQGNEDGILFAEEILDLKINAELVVLSSCDTASDSNDSSLELSGFAKGFIFAGAKNLIASMWPADDVGTQILMQRFYNHIADGHSPDQALTRAKRDLINMGGPIANPYFWAGFIHIGAPNGMMKAAA